MAQSFERTSMRVALKKNGPQALGRSRGGLTTKIHAAVEGLGNLASFNLTGGNAHDSTEAQPLLNDIAAQANGEVKTVTADRGYDSAAIVAAIVALGAEAVIPPLSNRKNPRPVDWPNTRIGTSSNASSPD